LPLYTAYEKGGGIFNIQKIPAVGRSKKVKKAFFGQFLSSLQNKLKCENFQKVVQQTNFLINF
jgi:hypothetical protein